MPLQLRLLVVVILALLCTRPCAAQKASATVRSSKTFLGRPFVYTLTLTDAGEAKIGEFNPKDFDVIRRGGPSTSSRTMIINGRRSSSESVTYQYVLRSRTSGTFKIKPPTVNYLGEFLSVDEIEVEVVGPQESELFELVARVDRESVYLLQRFTIELEVNLRELDKPFRVLSPVASQVLGGERPQLQIPWLDDESLPKGIESEPFDFNAILSRDRSGFGINGQASRSFFNSRELPFMPPEERIKRPGDSDDSEEVTWFSYRIKRTFIPTKAGRYSFGRASMQGRLVAEIKGTSGTLEDVYGVTEPVDIEVKPLPLDDRPDSWCGVIGELDVESTIAPTNARVGEPLTLTLSLTGRGLLSDAFPPELVAKDITDKFRVYEATSKPTNSGRVFTYSLRAKEPGEVEFPPIELAWFDPNQERYVTGKTSPIPLTITQAKALATDSILAAPQVQSSALQATSGGLAANMTSLQVVNLKPVFWFWTWGGIAGATAVAWLFLGRTESDAQLVRVKRKQKLDDANSRLNDGLKNLAANETNTALDAFRAAVNAVANAVADTEDSGLTTEEATDRLKNGGISDDLTDRCRDLLEQMDAARYGGLAGSLEQFQQQAKSTIDDLIKAARGIKL